MSKKVTMTKTTGLFARMVFTWVDSETCDHVAMGVSDDDFDAVLAAGGHEGQPVEGWTTVVS